MLRVFPHHGLTVSPFEDWNQANLSLGLAYLVPWDPNRIGGSKLALTEVTRQLLRVEDILAIRMIL